MCVLPTTDNAVFNCAGAEPPSPAEPPAVAPATPHVEVNPEAPVAETPELTPVAAEEDAEEEAAAEAAAPSRSGGRKRAAPTSSGRRGKR